MRCIIRLLWSVTVRRAHRIWIVFVVVGLTSSACGSSRPDGDSGSPPVAVETAARQSVGPGIFGPQASYEPVAVVLDRGTLPRSAEFLGVLFTVEAARVTNTHPYASGEPSPGPQLYAVLDVTAVNTGSSAAEYGFDAGAFGLRTYSGQLIATVEPPGVYEFRRLEPGTTGRDLLVFGVYTSDVLDGASLMIGRPPDAPTVLPLTAPERDPRYPVAILAATGEPVQAGAIAWSILDGEGSLDRPAGVCCPDTGERADEGELYVTLALRGLVRGSRYGQATISSEAVRLVVDSIAHEPFGFKGKANVAEGSAFDFEVTWLVPAGAHAVALQVGTGTTEATLITLGIGLAPASTETAATPQPSASPEPSVTAEPSANVESPATMEPSPARAPSDDAPGYWPKSPRASMAIQRPKRMPKRSSATSAMRRRS